MKEIAVFGIDVGYNATKVATRDEGNIIMSAFSSVARRVSTQELDGSKELLKINEASVHVKVDQSLYEVNTADNSLPSAEHIRTETDEFPRSDEYKALVLAVLTRQDVSRVRCLVLGLPMHNMRLAKELKERFTGKHELVAGLCVIEKVLVLEQPMGSFITARVSKPEIFSAHSSTCFIDAGWYSVDWVTFSGVSTLDRARSGGRPGGAAKVLRAVSAALGKNTGRRFDGLDRIDYFIRSGQPIPAYGKEFDLTPHLNEINHVTEEIGKAIKTKLGTTEDVSVFITGGAAHYYAHAIEKTLGCTVRQLENPRFANVKGFLLTGEAAIRSAR